MTVLLEWVFSWVVLEGRVHTYFKRMGRAIAASYCCNPSPEGVFMLPSWGTKDFKLLFNPSCNHIFGWPGEFKISPKARCGTFYWQRGAPPRLGKFPGIPSDKRSAYNPHIHYPCISDTTLLSMALKRSLHYQSPSGKGPDSGSELAEQAANPLHEGGLQPQKAGLT